MTELTFSEQVLVGLLLAWFLLSIIQQFFTAISRKSKRPLTFFERAWSKVSFLDVFSLIPVWTFFAPNPMTVDYHILFRDKRSNGNVSSWEPIPMLDVVRWYHFLFNPTLRTRKAALDLSQHVMRIAYETEEQHKNRLLISGPYLGLLNMVNGKTEQRTNLGTMRQFCIVKTSGYFDGSNDQVLFKSEFHSLR